MVGETGGILGMKIGPFWDGAFVGGDSLEDEGADAGLARAGLLGAGLLGAGLALDLSSLRRELEASRERDAPVLGRIPLFDSDDGPFCTGISIT